LRQKSSTGLAVMTDATKALNVQIKKVEDTPADEFFMNTEQLNGVNNDVVMTKKLLFASDLYLKENYLTALTDLRATIDRYAKALLAKLKDDRKHVIRQGFNLSGGEVTERFIEREMIQLRVDQQRNADHGRAAQLAKDLLALEKLVDQIAQSAAEIVAALSEAMAEADRLKDLLKKGQRQVWWGNEQSVVLHTRS